MKTIDSQTICLGTVLLGIFLFSQPTLAQTPDSLPATHGGSLQFQLLGNLGVFYIGNCSPTSYFRIGVDGSFDHSNNSGDGDSYSLYSSIPGTPSSSVNISQPEQNTTSYQLSVTGIYALKAATYDNVSLSCGVGPMVSYFHGKYASSSASTRIDGSGTYVDTYTNSSISKTWGVGPMALVGLTSPLMGHVSLSAEMNLSVLYQWSSYTNASRSASAGTSAIAYSNANGGTSSLKGWNISLTKIRIGVIVEL